MKSQPRAPLPPLQYTLAPCPGCQRTVLMRVWNKGNWVELPDVQEPVTGTKHVCQKTKS